MIKDIKNMILHFKHYKNMSNNIKLQYSFK